MFLAKTKEQRPHFSRFVERSLLIPDSVQAGKRFNSPVQPIIDIRPTNATVSLTSKLRVRSFIERVFLLSIRRLLDWF